MTFEREKYTPSDVAEWHPPKDMGETKLPKIEVFKNEPTGDEKKAPQAEKAMEQFHPTADNPIEKIIIGLWHTVGQVDVPTRVVVTLKDGQEASIPWEQAEQLLPPEYKTVRELGQRARSVEHIANFLSTAIRSGTDVMQKTGHIKNGLFRIIGHKTKAVQYLEAIDAKEGLAIEISNIAQQSFMELRRMTNVRHSRAAEIQALADKLDNCEKKLHELCKNVFRDFENVSSLYDKFVSDRERNDRLLEKERMAQLDAPEGPKK